MRSDQLSNPSTQIYFIEAAYAFLGRQAIWPSRAGHKSSSDATRPRLAAEAERERERENREPEKGEGESYTISRCSSGIWCSRSESVLVSSAGD